MAVDASQGKHSTNFLTDLRSLAGNGYRRLIGYKRKGVKTTVSVNPGTIASGATGTAAVAITGVSLANRRTQKVVAVPPATLDAGLKYMGAVITGTDEVTISVENRTLSEIAAVAVNWDVYFFDGGN